MQFNVCMLQWSKQPIIELCTNMCIHVCVYIDISPMHATSVQAIDHRVQTYAVQLIHAEIIQTIDQSAQKYCKQHANVCMHTCTKHEHMQFNVCMLQWSKQPIIELCICMCTCVHICICVHMCAHACMCAYVDVCMHTRTKCDNTQFSLCMLRWFK